MSFHEVVVVSAKRTPIGLFQGVMTPLSTTQLGSIAIEAALHEGDIHEDSVDEVYMGCVLPAALGQAPARQAALGAGLAKQTACTTVNKVCGSGMKAVMLAFDQLRLGEAKTIVAGGMESMTNAPYLVDKARSGYRLGHGKLLDHMYYDGLEDAYHPGRLMGTFAEDTAEHYHFTRQAQDEFALQSLNKAKQAAKNGDFKDEIIVVKMTSKKGGDEIIDCDEGPTRLNPDKISSLKPVFKEGGTVTAANSSSIADGGAALVLMTEEQARASRKNALAKIISYATFAHEPQWFTTAPVGAIRKLCDKIKWSIDDVDLFEINEAFAVVSMAAICDLKIPVNKVNVNGGACALGHPIGCSGARLIVTLIHALRKRGLKRGIASLCLGGGEAVALAVEV
jgi:acetyl-CoA C-acetyltransferase